MSVSKVVEEENCNVDFYPTHCVIQEKNTGKIKGVGRAVNGLYYLVEEPLEKIMEKLKNGTLSVQNMKANLKHNQAMNATEKQSLPGTIWKDTKLSQTALWHHRLGHAPLSKIKKIEGLKGFDGNSGEVCLTCPLGKFTKLPYKLSRSRAKQILEMIHIDIWGPYKVATRRGHRFFLTLVDDHTRVTWVQLLRNKSESYEAIKNFIVMGEHQYGGQVKIIRSDNAQEFDDKSCRAMYEKMGIKHETSCVDRPQQNGRVERRHRSILEMARTLRFQAGLPLSFWGDCVLAAVHIINRLPIPILDWKTPYEVLHKTKPKYDHLKPFGCLAVASNPSRTKDKFDARGVLCVFLGYPQTQKGYKLLNLSTNVVFVSRDVKFFEHIYPYKLFHKNNNESHEVRYDVTLKESEMWSDHDCEGGYETESGSEPEPYETNLIDDEHSETYRTPSVQPPQTRKSPRTHKQPSWMNDYHTTLPHSTNAPTKIDNCTEISVSPSFSCFMSHTLKIEEPKCFKEAVKHACWVKAMNEELEALETNNTWEIVDLPKKQNTHRVQVAI
ncbi:Retrovirus-related Pol polyprotein from transposon TNT 1-94 [Bienertia sinuspersici]